MSTRKLILKQVPQIDEVLVHQVHRCHKVRLCPKYRWCLKCHHIRWPDRIKHRPHCHPTYQCHRNFSLRQWVMTHQCPSWNRKKRSKYRWCRLIKNRQWWWADRRCNHSISHRRHPCRSIEKCRPVRIATFVSAIPRRIKRRVAWRSWCPVTIVDDQVRVGIGSRPGGGTTSRNGGARRSRQRLTVLCKLVDLRLCAPPYRPNILLPVFFFTETTTYKIFTRFGDLLSFFFLAVILRNLFLFFCSLFSLYRVHILISVSTDTF